LAVYSSRDRRFSRGADDTALEGTCQLPSISNTQKDDWRDVLLYHRDFPFIVARRKEILGKSLAGAVGPELSRKPPTRLLAYP
jgi:hypothetical protein